MARGGKRTYTRDANGRFASTPGGGLGAARKAARSRSGRTSTLGARTSLKRSRAKLASKDPADQRLSTALSARAQKGAVTRGSKGLKAAKVAARARISGSKTDGTIKKVINKKPQALLSEFRPGKFKKLKTMQGVSYEKAAPKTADSFAEKQVKPKTLADSRVKPGEFYRGNFRPRNITGKPIRAVNPFTRGSDAAAAEKNTRIAKELTISRGIPARISSGSGRTGRMGTATITPDGKARIAYNKSEPGWADIHGTAIAARRSRFWSSSSPMHAVNHEIGHTKDKRMVERKSGGTDSWALASTSKSYQRRIKDGSKYMELARRRVGTYAYSSPSEFVAEVYAARRGGRKFDHEVMNAYNEISGRPSKNLRNQKPRRRKPKS